MYKLLFAMLILFVSLNASSSFKETRYIYAIDKKLILEGDIFFTEQSIKIIYKKPQEKIIIYKRDDENLQKRVFFILLYAIEKNNIDFLKENFKLKKENNKNVLLPLEDLKNYIKRIEFIKSGEKLIYIDIFMKNEDWIKIETIR